MLWISEFVSLCSVGICPTTVADSQAYRLPALAFEDCLVGRRKPRQPLRELGRLQSICRERAHICTHGAHRQGMSSHFLTRMVGPTKSQRCILQHGVPAANVSCVFSAREADNTSTCGCLLSRALTWACRASSMDVIIVSGSEHWPTDGLVAWTLS